MSVCLSQVNMYYYVFVLDYLGTIVFQFVGLLVLYSIILERLIEIICIHGFSFLYNCFSKHFRFTTICGLGYTVSL